MIFKNKPNLNLESSNKVVLYTVVCIEFGKFAPQFDDVPVSIFPVAEKFEVFNQFFDVHVFIQTSSSLAGTYVN